MFRALPTRLASIFCGRILKSAVIPRELQVTEESRRPPLNFRGGGGASDSTGFFSRLKLPQNDSAFGGARTLSTRPLVGYPWNMSPLPVILLKVSVLWPIL